MHKQNNQNVLTKEHNNIVLNKGQKYSHHRHSLDSTDSSLYIVSKQAHKVRN